jgi:hypothetical protein
MDWPLATWKQKSEILLVRKMKWTRGYTIASGVGFVRRLEARKLNLTLRGIKE